MTRNFAPKKIFWQLYPSYLMVGLLIIFGISIFTIQTYKSFHLKRVEHSLLAHTTFFKELLFLKTKGEIKDPLRMDPLCKKLGETTKLRLSIILPEGKVTGDSVEDPDRMDNHSNRPEVKDALSPSGKGVSLRFSQTLRKDMMYLAIPLKREDSVEAIIRASISVNLINEERQQFIFNIITCGLLFSIFVALLSYRLSRKISIPLEELIKVSLSYSKGEMDVPLPKKASLEMDELALAMRRMALELNAKIHTISNQRQELETLLSSMAEGVIALDNNEYILSINQAAKKIFNLKIENIVGKPLIEVIRNSELKKVISQTISDQKTIEVEMTNGTHPMRYLNIISSPWQSGAETPVGVVVVIGDISRIKSLENIRKEFVANVSHELKTPITSIKGYVETLLDGALEEKGTAENFLNIIHKQSERLQNIIEDLLTLSRIEQKKGELPFEFVSIKGIIESAIAACQEPANQNTITIELIEEQEVESLIHPFLLEQSIINLLDNAIKYSKTDKIQVKLSKSKDMAMIEVRDHGIGIPEEHISRLPERFYRIDKARSRKQGGTGLGLAIVKHIVEAHNGHLNIRSKEGEGSSFSLILPITK